MRFAPLAFATAAWLAGSAVALADPWSYTDGSGQTVTLDKVPTRIIASQDAAAGLIPLGIRPVGIYADSSIAAAKALEGLDLSGIEIIGEAWGEADIEKAAALAPELIISEYWPISGDWSGGPMAAQDGVLRQVAPLTGPSVGESILTLIEDYEALARSLGADLEKPDLAADKQAFETALEGFKAAVAAKPGLTALAVWAGADGLYVATPEGSSELLDFQRWGLDVITPSAVDVNGYWQTLSWENADTYQPDLVLVDNRSTDTLATALAQPTWTSIRAAAAGAVADWPAFWVRNYGAYAGALEQLTAAIAAADPDIGD